MASEKQVIVIDNGTGYTKMGYSGNAEPTFITPTAVALAEDAGVGGGKEGLSDLDFYTGDDVSCRTRASCGICRWILPWPHSLVARYPHRLLDSAGHCTLEDPSAQLSHSARLGR